MGLGDWLATGIAAVYSGAAEVNNLINPFSSPPPAAKQFQHAPGTQGDPNAGPNILQPQLESALQAVNWFRQKAVSQPLATSLLVASKGSESRYSGDPGFFFDSKNWSDAWTASAHISPGQAFLLNPDQGEASKAEASPLAYYKPADSYLPVGFNQLPQDQQQEMLKNAGMPAVGNQYVELRRDSDLYKYGSGGLDFMAASFLDPTVIAGKGIGRLRSTVVADAGAKAALGNIFTGNLSKDATSMVRPRPSPANILASKVIPGVQLKNLGWDKVDIDRLVNTSRLKQAQDFLWQNKDNPQLVNQLPLATKTALGPRMGAIVATLQSPEEVNLFLRTGMGDIAARSILQAKNAAAKVAMEQDTNRLSSLELQRSINVKNPYAVQLINARMAAIQDGMNANADLVTRFNNVLDHANEIDNVRMNANAFAQAKVAQASQNAYTAGAGRRASLVVTGAPLTGSLVKQRLVTNVFSTPITMIRSFSNFKPQGYMALDDVTQDSVNELRGFLARIPNFAPQARENAVNEFLQAPDAGSRLDMLQQISSLAMGKIAQKHGLTPEYGAGLYAEHQDRLASEIAGLKQYSAVKTAAIGVGNQRSIRVDAFTDTGGGLSIHPNMVTRLMNDHILPDLDMYDTVLGRHSSALGALAVKGGDVRDAIANSGEFLNKAWKFGTLARLGYIPRVLGDDIGGQIARLGMASMAIRAGYGVKNLATNMSNMMIHPFLQAGAEARRVGAAYAQAEMQHVDHDIAAVTARIHAQEPMRLNVHNAALARMQASDAKLAQMQADATTPPARLAAMQALAAKNRAQSQTAHGRLYGKGTVWGDQLDQLVDRRAFLTDSYNRAMAEADALSAHAEKVTQGSQIVHAQGLDLPAAFGGTRGQYYQKTISGDESLANVFNTNKQMIEGNLMRSYQHGTVGVDPNVDPELHLKAWSHILTAQMGQDVAGRIALKNVTNGLSVDQTVQTLLDWFKTAEGSAYRNELGPAGRNALEAANSIAHDVHEMAMTPEIAEQAMSPEGVDGAFLKKAIPVVGQRPDAIAPAIGLNTLNGTRFKGTMDRVIQHWFDAVATLPANRWSRHPLFNQLYEGHARAIVGQEAKQGIVHTSEDADRIAETARRLALKDTRNLVFDIAHQSDAMAALRMTSPFFSASLEGWQRWSRIILDRPQTVGYAAKFFNAPLSAGWVQDQDGNHVDADGRAFDPVQGKMVDVPMSNRRIVARVPWGLARGGILNPIATILGANGDGQVNLSQSSMNIVLNGDPWFNPGQGPLVTIPLQEYVKDKPSDALLARQLGVLPFGVSNASGGVLGRAVDQFEPRTIKDFLIGFNTSDSRYQQVKLQITQDAYYNHANLGQPMPTAAKIAQMTRDYWVFSAASAFSGPVAGQRPDPFAFYRDQYNNLRRTNASTADSTFLAKYGESYFVFAQAMSKNAAGVGATLKATQLEKQYGQQISENPELAGLIIGPQGNGPFSPEAYTYELNTPLIPGGEEMMRTKMSATEAMAENQKRLGWAKYTGVMNNLNAQLINQGFKTFQDNGAEALNGMRQAYVKLFGQPLLPTGQPNPFYNDAWSKDYNSFDSLKYERLIPGLQKVAASPLADDPARSDLRVLRTYLAQRSAMTQILNARNAAGGSADIKAQSNGDLVRAWINATQGLVESDVNFGNLYHRYLSRDLGVDAAPEAAQQPTTPGMGA